MVHVFLEVEMRICGTFYIDEDSSDEESLFVDVWGKGTVYIKAEDDGIVVDIFPFHVVDAPVASTWAHMNELMHPDLLE